MKQVVVKNANNINFYSKDKFIQNNKVKTMKQAWLKYKSNNNSYSGAAIDPLE